jgi:glutathione S-transferase
MSDPIVYGFPRSTYVNIVRLILTHKDVPYTFHGDGQARASGAASV